MPGLSPLTLSAGSSIAGGYSSLMRRLGGELMVRSAAVSLLAMAYCLRRQLSTLARLTHALLDHATREPRRRLGRVVWPVIDYAMHPSVSIFSLNYSFSAVVRRDAELAHGVDCRCFYTNGMYVSHPVEAYINFLDIERFEEDYCYLYHALSDQQLSELFDQLHAEAAKRRREVWLAASIKQRIAREYKPLWPSLWKLSMDHLNLDLVDMVNGDIVPEELGEGGIFLVPIFNARFCEMLCEELDRFEATRLGQQRSRNTPGVLLDELGMTEGLILPLMHEWIKPLCARFNLFLPESEGLDYAKAYVVRYRKGEDENLFMHVDNSEVTLNVSLGRTFEAGELAFFGLRSEPMPPPPFYHDWEDEGVGYAVLHRGQELHCPLPISDGERINLVIWMRSTQWRREHGCPMCGTNKSLLKPLETK